MINSLNDCPCEFKDGSLIYINKETGQTILQASFNGYWNGIPCVLINYNGGHNTNGIIRNRHLLWQSFVERIKRSMTNELILKKMLENMK